MKEESRLKNSINRDTSFVGVTTLFQIQSLKCHSDIEGILVHEFDKPRHLLRRCDNPIPNSKTDLPNLNSIIHVLYYSFTLLFMYSGTLNLPPLDPTGLAALQIPRSTRPDSPRCKSPARSDGPRRAANPPLDPTGLAALQIPRSTRRNFAPPQPQPQP